jgi:lysophospholipase L1-like esterase
MTRYLLLIMLCLLAFKHKHPVNIYMIGDSTMANKSPDKAPETGWGQVLHLFFKDGVKIHNHAQNGRSSKSFMDEGRWKIVLDSLKKGDYVIIQFGHNDEKNDSARHTDPFTTYMANLETYVNEARTKGAFPVLCTSIVRRKFNAQGHLEDTHGDYPKATRIIAKKLNVPVIDLEKRTGELVTKYGPEQSKKLYLYSKPGEFNTRPDGVSDDTHLCVKGATEVARLAIEEMKVMKMPLERYIK